MSAPLVSIKKRVIKLQPTFVADDNEDNDVAFDWIELSDAASDNGRASTLNSIFILNGYDEAAVMEIVFCRGVGASGTAPTSAQGLTDGVGTGSAVIDTTQPETQAIQICGRVLMTADDWAEGDLLISRMASKTNIGLVMSPSLNSTSLYVGAIWRYEPASGASKGTQLMDFYFGFED